MVGAGPGDPELLTVRALKRLEAADIVFHDSLISEEVLALIPQEVELINVGKRCGDEKDRGLQQQEIHELLVSHAKRGRRVVRLKCGDPLVFGRGGEELEYLAVNGIAAEVVPGITSALGAAASCQVPLTHRCFGVNQVRFVVGQTKTKGLPDLDWSELAKQCQSLTTVFYMGMKSLDSICKSLLDHGAQAETPMVLIESATAPTEQAVFGTIGSMPKQAKEHEVLAHGGPVLFIVGPTAHFPQHLAKLAEGRPWKRARVTPADDC